MAQESGADDATDQTPLPPRAPRTTPPGRPPRPAMSDVTPAPVPRPVPPTTTIKVSGAVWVVSILLGLAIAIFLALDREDLIAQVTELVTGQRPDRAAETIESVAGLVFWGTVGSLVAMVFIEALLVRAVMRRHGRARYALIVIVVVHIAVAVLADAFALLSTEPGMWFRLVLIAELLLAVVALVIAFLPGAAAWFRVGRSRTRR